MGNTNRSTVLTVCLIWASSAINSTGFAGAAETQSPTQAQARYADGGSAVRGRAAPPVPTIAPLPSLTKAREIRVKGGALAKLRVTVEGGEKTVRTRADAKGQFDLEVKLQRDQINSLLIHTTDADGRNSQTVSVAITQDSTVPHIAAMLDPLPNRFGWNSGNVTVSFTCADSSGIAHCPLPVAVTTEGANQHIAATAVDNAGNRNRLSVRVNIDRTPPAAQIELTPTPKPAGWNRGRVTVSFTCREASHGSGIAQCPAPVEVTDEGAGREVSGTVIDKAGNEATVHTLVNIDRTAPVVTIDELRDGTLVYGTPVHLTGHVSEGLSGLASVNCGQSVASLVGLDYSCDQPVKIGKHKVQVWSNDQAGNVGVSRRVLALGPRLPGGDAHRVLVSADVDGDGQADVLHTNFLAGDVSILLSNGNGTFQRERRLAVGDYPSSIAVADVNGDGLLDLITTHYTTAEVAIQYGQSDGSYVPGPRMAVDAFPTAAVVADVNEDRRPDIITTHMRNRQVHVHLAQADGSFASQPSVKVGEGPVALAIGDVDGDGALVCSTRGGADRRTQWRWHSRHRSRRLWIE